MKKEKEYFYLTLGNLKNADCFDLNKWQWEYIKESWLEKKHHKWEDINIIGITKIINAIAMYPKYIRYSLKQHQITHETHDQKQEFIMTQLNEIIKNGGTYGEYHSLKVHLQKYFDLINKKKTLKSNKITHEFIMTSGEYWKLDNFWIKNFFYLSSDTNGVPYYINLNNIENTEDLGIYRFSKEWFQTAKHCKCPPEVIK